VTPATAANRYPVKPVRLPADLRGIKPGELPPYLLRAIRPYGQLHPLAAQAWEALRKAAHADGIRPFKPTSFADTYRTLATQRAGFLARYTTAPIQTTSVRTYEGVKYYLKPGMAPMATPGTSVHNIALAVDVSEASGDRLKWMLANCDDYGWCWELQSEPWHIRYYTGDKVPLKVQQYVELHANRDHSRPD
jgi:LAS superfamily LD-carboxypeptidase LdcB